VLEAAGVSVDTAEFAAEPPYDIAAVVQGPTNGWGTTFDAVMNDAFEQSGKVGELMYVPWDFVTENQVKGVEDAIAADVDAILLTSLSRAGLVSAVERAGEAGIPVVTCLAGVQSDAYTAEVSRDIPMMGFTTADEMAKRLDGEGKVVMLHGIAGADAAEFWKSGAEAAFSQYPGIEIVSEQYANWSAAEAIDVMRTVIAQTPDIDAVWVGGLEMGPAVIEAYQEAGVELPLMGGTNPTNGFLRLAIEQDLDFFVAPFPAAAAQECVNTVFKVLEGEPVAKYTDVIDVMEGTAPYDESEAETWFEPDFNDDFVGPKVTDDQVYLDAGFGK
jgi:ribose transport system substrate-binding protein